MPIIEAISRPAHEGRTIRRAARLGMLALLPLLAAAAAPDPTIVADAATVRAQVDAMERAMKPGQGFAWQPLVRHGGVVAAIEVWKTPGKPAIHPDEAEYTTVLAGTGTLVSGGTMVDAKVTHPNLVEGTRIEGGTTRALAPGDVVLIPAGTPHWFGISNGPLVLLGTKIPDHPAPQAAP